MTELPSVSNAVRVLSKREARGPGKERGKGRHSREGATKQSFLGCLSRALNNRWEICLKEKGA